MNRQETRQTRNINNKNDPQKKKMLQQEGLNKFHRANLALSSDVDQDT